MAITAETIGALTAQINSGFMADYEGRTAHDKTSLELLIKACGGDTADAEGVSLGDNGQYSIQTLPHLSVLLPNLTDASHLVTTDIETLRQMATAQGVEGAGDKEKDELIALLEAKRQEVIPGDGVTVVPPVEPGVRDAATGTQAETPKITTETDNPDDTPPAPPAPASKYAKVPPAALKAQALERGIEGADSMKQAALIAALDADDKAKADAASVPPGPDDLTPAP